MQRRRVCVLARRDGCTAPAPAVELLTRAEVRRARTESFEDRVLRELRALGREAYSVELAERLGEPYGTVKGALIRLQAAGVLTSRYVPGEQCGSPSGPGRRYYALRESEASR